MNINLNMLIEKLKPLSPKTYIIKQEGIYIESIKLITKKQTLFEPSILYISKASSLPQIEIYSNTINLLCIEDIPIPSEYIKNLRLNLVTLDSTNDLFTIFNEVQDILTKFNQWYSTLMDSLITNKGLQEILDIGYKLIENPIVLFDISFKILGQTKLIELDEPIWKESLIKGYFPNEYVSKIKTFKCVEKVYKSRFPVLEGLVTEKYEKMISNIIIHNKIVAHLKVFECNRPFKNSDFEIVSFLSNIISSEMQKTKFFQSTKGVMYEYFIADLLEGKVKESEAIEERIKYLDLNFKKNFYIISISSDAFNDENSPVLQIRDYLENMISDSKSIIYKDYIVMFISRRHKNGLLEKELKTLEEFLITNRLRAGFSRCFTSLTEAQKHFLQSLKALKLGTRMHKNKCFFQYNNYAIYHMMDVHSVETLKDFCHPSLLALIEYDKQNNTNYIQSLYTYISKDKNKVATADLLHIHRNTLNYRIAKIREITEFDLDDKDLLFHLNLSFKILEFAEKKEFTC